MKLERMIRDEEGFTTAGMAIALLVSLSLLFSAAQVYRINTMAAEVQEVADAAALAAEGQVAEFMVAVRVADGAVLSMTLLGVASYGLGIVGLCVPPAAELGSQLVSIGQKVLHARDAFAQRAASALDSLQRALPFLAAASAATVAHANGSAAGGYYAMALLLPAEGAPIAVGSNGAEATLEQEVEAKGGDLAEAAARAEEAVRQANEAKERAFKRDCGDYPAYCMAERAEHLASLEAARNPLYASVDNWSFSVALERARSYYAARLLGEAPEGTSTEEKARSALRRHYYRYAASTLWEACAQAPDGTGAVSFPLLPRNTEQMRETSLYTDPAYPVDVEGEAPVMHAWEGCPGLGLTDHYASVRTLEGGGFAECPECRFSASSLGNVAAASTSIENGFEYHYLAVAQAAEDYRRAVREAEPLTSAVKSEAQGLIDKALDALRGAASFRIEARPPGSAGCIALAVCPEGSATGAFESAFAGNGGTLGTRAAVSGATLIADEDGDASVVGDLLDGLKDDGSAVVGAAALALDCWSALLNAYGEGQEALVSGIEGALDRLPLVGAAGLGSWAADALRDGLRTVGLEPAETAPLKPVLANTGAVARADGGPFSVRYLTVQSQVMAAPASSADSFSILAERIEREAFDRLGSGEITLATIEFPWGGGIPLTVTLPSAVREGAQGLVEQGVDAVRAALGRLGMEIAWE